MKMESNTKALGARGLAALIAMIAAFAGTLAWAAAAHASLEITEFSASFHAPDPTETPITQAGAHPDLSLQFRLGDDNGGFLDKEGMRDVVVDLPAGFYGNPQAMPQCPQSEFANLSSVGCSAETQVGIVDELAFLTAYHPERDQRKRAEAALATLTSQGRSVGVCVLATLQDPRKEVINLRNLFPTRIALRLDESEQVDMVLGDGSRDRGALADEISPVPELGAGVGYVRLETSPDPVRVRAAYVTDADITAMVSALTLTGAPRAGEAA